TVPPSLTSYAPRLPLPQVMTTRATTAASNLTPRNESPFASERRGAKNLPRLPPSLSISSIDVDWSTSTSENTAPKPVTTAGVVAPGTWNAALITWPKTAENITFGLNGLNSSTYVGLISVKLRLSLRNVPPS